MNARLRMSGLALLRRLITSVESPAVELIADSNLIRSDGNIFFVTEHQAAGLSKISNCYRPQSPPPIGDPTPSRAEIQMTQAIIEVARPLGIAVHDVHDHIILGKDEHASRKALKLI